VALTAAKASAHYHTVYFDTLPPKNKGLYSELVLRISGFYLLMVQAVNEMV
jgi:hypothetical protein